LFLVIFYPAIGCNQLYLNSLCDIFQKTLNGAAAGAANRMGVAILVLSPPPGTGMILWVPQRKAGGGKSLQDAYLGHWL
jgi:hypothetical protein